MSKHDDWLRRYREAGAVFTTDPCGCLVFVVVDMPEEVSAASKTLAREVAAGRMPQRVADRRNLPPLYCPEHRLATGPTHAASAT